MAVENSPYHQQSCKLPGYGVRVPEADFGTGIGLETTTGLAAEAGKDGRPAGETCSLPLATSGREPSDAAVSEKLMQHATTAGVQDSLKAEESRSHHVGEGKCTDKNAPKGLAWRQLEVYSQVSERQKADSGSTTSEQAAWVYNACRFRGQKRNLGSILTARLKKTLSGCWVYPKRRSARPGANRWLIIVLCGQTWD